MIKRPVEKIVKAIEAAKRYVEACHFEDEEDMNKRMAQIMSTRRMPVDEFIAMCLLAELIEYETLTAFQRQR